MTFSYFTGALDIWRMSLVGKYRISFSCLSLYPLDYSSGQFVELSHAEDSLHCWKMKSIAFYVKPLDQLCDVWNVRQSAWKGDTKAENWNYTTLTGFIKTILLFIVVILINTRYAVDKMHSYILFYVILTITWLILGCTTNKCQTLALIFHLQVLSVFTA